MLRGCGIIDVVHRARGQHRERCLERREGVRIEAERREQRRKGSRLRCQQCQRHIGIAPPLRRRLLREHLGKFAHCDVFVDGLEKAGVPE